MKNSDVVSSAQALDEYFDALLLDVFSSHDQHIDTKVNSVDFSRSDFVLMPQSRMSLSSDICSLTLTEERRDLTSVEKLLRHLKFEDAPETEEKGLHFKTVEGTLITEKRGSPLVKEEEVTPNGVLVSLLKEEAFIENEKNIAPALETQKDIEIPSEVNSILENDFGFKASSNDKSLLEWENILSEETFQVLFFESFGVTYAVPLSQLGGIYRLKACNHLIGRPDWYLGLQIDNQKQFDVVDMAKWVMPEKIPDNTHRDDYNYIVVLDAGMWSLACNSLLGTQLLSKKQIRWREHAGKRPWLAGLVKEKMCALIHVEALIFMLNQGINAKTLA